MNFSKTLQNTSSKVVMELNLLPVTWKDQVINMKGAYVAMHEILQLPIPQVTHPLIIHCPGIYRYLLAKLAFPLKLAHLIRCTI